MQPYEFSACQAAKLIFQKKLSAFELLDSCLSRIALLEPHIHAWKYLDPELVRKKAHHLDSIPYSGPLHGIPIGIKDVIDTADMPSAYGSPIYENHRPAADAACVTYARHAGALIIGKTITTEFACGSTAPTLNPWNLDHTSGGSSSGSCAAVAAQMIPLAIGTQSASSTIRPSSYCGIVGMRPSMGTVSTAGFKYFNGSFDTIGFMGRNTDDIALLWSTQMSIPYMPASHSDKPVKILVCYPTWMRGCEPCASAAVEKTASVIANSGIEIELLELPEAYSDLPLLHHNIQRFETSRSYAYEYETNREKLDWRVRETIEAGMKISGEQYIDMLERAQKMRLDLASRIVHADAILTNAAFEEAPLNAQIMGDKFSMGDTRQSRPWTLLHVPTVTVPAILGPQNLPVGVQLIGKFGSDKRLLEIAQWVESLLVPSLTAARMTMQKELIAA